jgi:hypothetical protein
MEMIVFGENRKLSGGNGSNKVWRHSYHCMIICGFLNGASTSTKKS